LNEHLVRVHWARPERAYCTRWHRALPTSCCFPLSPRSFPWVSSTTTYPSDTLARPLVPSTTGHRRRRGRRFGHATAPNHLAESEAASTPRLNGQPPEFIRSSPTTPPVSLTSPPSSLAISGRRRNPLGDGTDQATWCLPSLSPSHHCLTDLHRPPPSSQRPQPSH
jgi:hypothetical protein